MKRIASILAFCTLCAMLAAMCLPAVAADTPSGIQVRGYVQNRFYAAEGSNATYRMERASLSLQGPVGSEGTGYTEVYFHPWIPASTNSEQFRVYLESAYVDWPVRLGRLRAGKGRNLTFGMVPSYPNRKTTNYGLVAETFTQDRIAGLQYYYEQPLWNAAVGIYTSENIGTRGTGGLSGVDPRGIPGRTDNQVFHLAERDIPSEALSTDRISGSGRIGIRRGQKLDAGLSLGYGKVNPEDLAFVNDNTLRTMTGRDHTRWGIDATWKPIAPWVIQGEFYGATLDDLDWNAWNILAGYEPKGKPRFYARYSQYNIDTPAIPVGTVAGTAPFGDVTWDQQQVTLSAVFPFRKYKSIWLQLEAEFNNEDPPAGVPKVDNNVVFLELFTGW